MWKVFLAFVTHRGLLLLVAWLTIQVTAPSASNHGVWPLVLSTASRGPEGQALERLVQESPGQALTQTRNPFRWAGYGAVRLTGFDPAVCLLIVSNLFLFLFLTELFSLFNRMVTTDISTTATIFVVLWPTSYEMSMGSGLALAGYFLTLSIRQALEQRWLFAGLAAGALALMDPIALALIPVYLYLFWGGQRFLPLMQWSRHLGFFLVPFVFGVLLSGESWRSVLSAVDQSAFLYVGEGFFSHSYAGQTLSWVFFLLGAIGALFSNVNPKHRFLPLGVLLGLLLSSPYNALASRAALAGICLEGIASASSGPASRLASSLMIVLGAYEVHTLFS